MLACPVDHWANQAVLEMLNGSAATATT